MKLKLILLLLILNIQSFANALVTINSDKVKLTDFEIEYFNDKSHKMSLNEVKKQKFIKSKNKNSLGIFARDIWLKINFINKTKRKQKLFLHNLYAYSNFNIEFYEFCKDKLLNTKIIKLKNNLDKDKMYGKNFIYDITLEKDQIKTLYIKSNVLIYNVFKLAIYDEVTSKKILLKENVYIMILVGFLFSLMIYNFLLYSNSKYKEYLYYTLYLLSAVVWIFTVYGILSQYFDIYGLFGYRFVISVIFLPIFLSYFIKYLFETKQRYKYEDKLLNSIIILFAIIITISFINFYISLVLASIAYLWVCGLFLWIGLSIYKKGNPAAKYFLLAHIFFIINGAVEVLFYLGLTPFNDFTEYSSAIGLSFETVILAYLLIYKIKLLRAKERLLEEQSKLAALGEMITNIAHQWKQPLAELSMYQNFIITKIKYSHISEGEIVKELKSQQKIVKFMSSTIDTFENFYKEREDETFQLIEAYQNTKLLLNETIKLNNIETIENIDSNITLKGNMNGLSQIILSMIQNSIHFFKIREIETPKLLISSFLQNSSIILEVEDNAGGIDKKYIKKIFDYNFSKRDSNTPSTGIGLYMVKNMIENKFNGTIDVNNTKDGVKFTITL